MTTEDIRKLVAKVRGKKLSKPIISRPKQKKETEWDKAFDKFSEKFDNEAEETFGDSSTWNDLIEDIGRVGGTDEPIDHEEELKFYVKSKKSSSQLKKAAKQLLERFIE